MTDGEYVCGEDFCDTCGDCLVCYIGDECRDGGHHWYDADDGSSFCVPA